MRKAKKGIVSLTSVLMFCVVTGAALTVAATLFTLYTGICERNITHVQDYYNARYGIDHARLLIMKRAVTTFPYSCALDLTGDAVDDVTVTISAGYSDGGDDYQDLTATSGTKTITAKFLRKSYVIVSIS